MTTAWLVERMKERGDAPAIVWRDETWSYRALADRESTWFERLQRELPNAKVVAVLADYSPEACAVLLALVRMGRIVVPLGPTSHSHHDEFVELSGAEGVIRIDRQLESTIDVRSPRLGHDLMRPLLESGTPGLLLFSSASTGKSKAALHDFGRLLEKYREPKKATRTLTFLQLDHVGGINTLFHTLANGGTVVTVAERNPDVVCAAIARNRVELLPTSPTFLNMLLVSEAYKRHDVSSLTLITYGTEVMPERTLAMVREALPHVRLLQTYGLTELGIFRTRSRDSHSLWVEIGGAGVETKVVDGQLWVRAKTAMLGYLNAPSPFDAQGWMNTEDVVEVDGPYFRILGRKTDIINVGGLKVYPAEVESVLLSAPNVADAVVTGQKNPVTGQVVAARVSLLEPEDIGDAQRRLRAHCQQSLPRHKMPLRIDIVTDVGVGARFKKNRSAVPRTSTLVAPDGGANG